MRHDPVAQVVAFLFGVAFDLHPRYVYPSVSRSFYKPSAHYYGSVVITWHWHVFCSINYIYGNTSY
jgi:hypothetical protein